MADFQEFKSKHPLWKRWLVLRRRAALCEAWRDFATFVEGVGDPGLSRKLARLRADEPLGPNNFRWTERMEGARKVEYHHTYNAAHYQRSREQWIIRKYGIDGAQYHAIYEAQGGGCAICRREVGEPTRRGGKRHKHLAVDHCHETGQVRGLLCTDCNVGLGLFGDSPALLEIAAAYIAKHARKLHVVAK